MNARVAIADMAIIADATSATDAKTTDAKKYTAEYCSDLRLEAKSEVKKLNSCWRDEECIAVHFGCAVQDFPCHFSLVSRKSKTRKAESLIKEIEENCIATGVLIENKCKGKNDIFLQESLFTKQQELCTLDFAPVCLNGSCVNQTYILMQEF